MDALKITEGVSGLWHYHLSLPASPSRGICGALVMHTAIPRSDWGLPFGEHFPKRPTWCAKCAVRAQEKAFPITGDDHGISKSP